MLDDSRSGEYIVEAAVVAMGEGDLFFRVGLIPRGIHHPGERQPQMFARIAELPFGAFEGVDLLEQFPVAPLQGRRLNVKAAFGAGVNSFRHHHRDHQRRHRLGHGPGHGRKWLELIVLTVPGHLFAGQQRGQNLERKWLNSMSVVLLKPARRCGRRFHRSDQGRGA